MNLSRSLSLAAAFALVSVPLLAASPSGSMQGMNNMQGMNMPGMDMSNMMGVHNMDATVDSVDTKTGIIEVTTSGVKLKLHFPPTSLVNLKAGDKITVHLAFTKSST